MEAVCAKTLRDVNRDSSENQRPKTFVKTICQIKSRRDSNRQPCFCDDTSRRLRPPGALDRSRVACDLERVEVLLKFNGPAVADRPDVGDLCFALLSLPVKPEVIITESHNSLAACTQKFRPRQRRVCQTPPLSVRKRLSAPQLSRDTGCGPPRANCQPQSRQCRQSNTTSLLRSRARLIVRRVFQYLRWYSRSIEIIPSNSLAHLG